MKLKKSLISVILPTYNSSKFLPACLDSLVKQTYADIEIIAIDDKSKDNSVKILQKYKIKYDRITILRNKKHYSMAICLNRALRMASGQFVTFMNPSDFVSHHRFTRQINYLSKHAKTVALGSQYVTVDPDNKRLERSRLPQEHEEIYHALLPSLALKPETIVINRLLLPKDLLYFTTNKYPLLFTEVIIKLLPYGKIANLSQSLYNHRIGIKRQRRVSKVTQAISTLKLLLKSRSNHNYRPNLKSLFPPLVKGI